MGSEKDKMLSILNPSPVGRNEFERAEKDISNKINRGLDIGDILYSYEDQPYYFKKNGKYLSSAKYVPSIKDIAHFYVLLNYLIYGTPGSQFDRDRYYKEFFSSGWNDIKQFIYDIVNKNSTDLFNDLEVDIISGSVYKIKKYFLENSKIKDIRGASAIIEHMNENVTLNYLEDNYIQECAIYCGGGNALIVAPRGQGERVCRDLESKYTEISLTAQNAFEHITCNLNELLTQYNTKMAELNWKLQERKKTKLYPIQPDNDLAYIKMEDQVIRFDRNPTLDEGGIVCTLCAVRDAKYSIPTPEGETVVCPSCLRKHFVGKDKAIFYDEYSETVNSRADYSIDSINDLRDDHGNIAVIYADGNNMGDVIRNIETPFQHMYFSRTLDRVTKECVYKSIYDVMGDRAKFEAIALGGDDIFIVVPGDTSLEVTNGIISKFDKAFNYNMTMSAGICIAKSTTPIQNMFGIARHMLKSAKELSREGDILEGTVDIQIIQSNMNIDLSRSQSVLFPATNSRLSNFIKVAKELKHDKDIKRSQLYKLRYAARILEPKEFQLFYLYQVSRTSSKYTEYISRLFNIEDGYFCGLIKHKDSKGKTTDISPWNDIVLLQDSIGGE